MIDAVKSMRMMNSIMAVVVDEASFRCRAHHDAIGLGASCHMMYEISPVAVY